MKKTPVGTPLLLTLLRHAKSSRKDPALDDFDRPLARRGRREAKRMARWIATELPPVVCVLLSPAKRTRHTFRIVRKAAGIPKRIVVRDHGLYLAPRPKLAARIRLHARGRHVLLVGHNPGISDLAGWLAGEPLAEMPTGGIVHLACRVTGWDKLAAGCATVLATAWPLRDDETGPPG